MMGIEWQKTALELMRTADVAYLTTVAMDGYPRTRAMFNLRNAEMFPGQVSLFAEHDEDLMLLFSTNTASSKIAEIHGNPRASVYFCAPKRFRGLMLAGDLAIVEDPALRQALWNEGWEQYYPGGPHDPDHTVLRLTPNYAAGWHNAEKFEARLGM